MAKVEAAAILGRLYASQATPDLCRNVWTCPVLARAIFRAGLTSSIRNSEAHPNGEAIVGTIRNRSDEIVSRLGAFVLKPPPLKTRQPKTLAALASLRRSIARLRRPTARLSVISFAGAAILGTSFAMAAYAALAMLDPGLGVGDFAYTIIGGPMAALIFDARRAAERACHSDGTALKRWSEVTPRQSRM